MVRPNKVKDGKITTVMFSKNDLEMIEKVRGKTSVSEYIRFLVENGLNPSKKEEEIVKLRKELYEKNGLIHAFERERHTVIEEKETKKDEIGISFKVYTGDNPYRKPSPSQCQNWLESRCKGTGVPITEMTIYLKKEGLL